MAFGLPIHCRRGSLGFEQGITYMKIFTVKPQLSGEIMSIQLLSSGSLRALGCFVVFWGLFGCSGYDGVKSSVNTAAIEELESVEGVVLSRVAVLPLAASLTEPASAHEVNSLTRSLVEMLESETGLVVANKASVDSVKLSSEDNLAIRSNPTTLFVRAQKLALESDVRFVVAGVASKSYEEPWRQEKQLEGMKVGFVLWLYDAVTRKPIWRASYTGRNQPVTSNFLRLPWLIQTGIRYKEYRELAIDGLVVAARKLESMRMDLATAKQTN